MEVFWVDLNVIFFFLILVNYVSLVLFILGLNNLIVSLDKGLKCNIVRGVEVVNVNGEIDRNLIKIWLNIVIKVRWIVGDESGVNVYV